MNIVIRSIIFLCVLAAPLLGEGPHLVLYFDVNKTLIATDMASNKSIDDVINEELAAKYVYCWDESLLSPMSYREYIDNVVVPDGKSRAMRKAYLYNFLEYLRESEHPLFFEAKKKFENVKTCLIQSPSVIFPSFFRLIDYLNGEGISYTIILRSYGHEIYDVQDEINYYYAGDLVTQSGQFREGRLIIGEDKRILSDSLEIYKYLCRSGHLAIQDDWNYWSTHGLKKEMGKPFYVDLEDEEVFSIFFDDNIMDSEVMNIVAPINPKTGESLSVQQMRELGRVMKVDTFEAILDSDYFVDFVQKFYGCLQKA